MQGCGNSITLRDRRMALDSSLSHTEGSQAPRYIQSFSLCTIRGMQVGSQTFPFGIMNNSFVYNSFIKQ